MRKILPTQLFLALGIASLPFFLSSCGGAEPSQVSQPLTAADGGTVSIADDIIIRVPAGALSEDAMVTITRATEANPPPGRLEGAQSVGDAFNIDIGGAELVKPVILEIAYDPALLPEDSPEDAVFLAFYDEEGEQWVPVYGTVDFARHVVVIETDHLSWWNPFSWNLSELVAKIRRGLEGILRAVGLPVAEIPQCGSPPAHMTLNFTDSLLACIEGTNTQGQAVLRLANNRAYATLLNLSPGTQLNSVSHGSLTDTAWALLVERLGKDVVYVPPAGQAELLLQFDSGGEITLSSTPSDVTLALDMLLGIFSALGVDPDNVIGGLKCLFNIITPERPGTPTLGTLFDVVKDCVGVALKGTAGIVWAAIKTLVTLGAAAGELLVQRTAELFGSDEGRVTLTYSPPQPAPPSPEATTPAPEVMGTKIITVPLEPDQELEGSCWMGSPALAIPNAWRCSFDEWDPDLGVTVGKIEDSCLSDMLNYPMFSDTFVICTGNPFNPYNEVVKLNLTEPLPVAKANWTLSLVVWRLELSDGAKCDYMVGPTGTMPEDVARMRGARIRFECDDGWYVTDIRGFADYMPVPSIWTTSEVQTEPYYWIATKVRWDGYQITESIEAPIRTVWY